ncbi:acetate uptake transporter [Actinocrinis puniceicyclus]|uniref:Acetate uptake transporter n=1 Tax=Actinocrinis puniceicyclus TaxID=977794 RepID=A0A8J8BB58_9ACTN|nr:acetate uptake transporter [Actinocrinis puniceicyclus]
MTVVSNEAPTTSTPVTVADPAPLGLAGFAMTTLALSFGNANLIKETGAITIVLGLATFYGGIAQLLAGMWEFRRGNTFGATAFSSFGAFWLSFWYINTHLTAASGDVHQAIGLYLLLWAIFTAFMTVAALRTSLAVLVVFVLLTLAFLFLAIGAFQNGTPAPDTMTKIGGWLGIATGVAAWYAAAATVINATHRRDVLPTLPR